MPGGTLKITRRKRKKVSKVKKAGAKAKAAIAKSRVTRARNRVARITQSAKAKLPAARAGQKERARVKFVSNLRGGSKKVAEAPRERPIRRKKKK